MFSEIVRVILYVSDVQKSAAFWKKIGFVEKESTEVDGTLVVELAVSATASTHLVLYDRQVMAGGLQEDMAGAPPLMFASEDTIALYKTLQELGVTLGDLVHLGEEYVFNFVDNEGNYFAVSGK
jgi:lactoylglutathione lyase